MKTLVAGFGNVLLGDDGFGVEVVRRLAARGLPPATEAIDVGIGGLDFVFKLMDGYDRAIIVDAVRRGEAPGTVVVFRPDEAARAVGTPAPLAGISIDPHIAEPARAMTLARHLGALPADVTLVGCEPASCDVGIGLSSPVAAAVERALEAIDSILNAWTSNSSKS